MDKRRKNIIGYEFLHQKFLFVCFSIFNIPLWLPWFSEMSFLIKVLCGLQFCKLKWIKTSFCQRISWHPQPPPGNNWRHPGVSQTGSEITTFYVASLVLLWDLNWQRQFIRGAWLNVHGLLINLQALGEPWKMPSFFSKEGEQKRSNCRCVSVCV